jgi:hypothetical protein
MSEQILKDKLEIRDKLGNKLGTYDSKRNETYNKLGNKIGSGNLLTTLLVNF